MTDDSTPTEKDPLEQAEERLEQAERSVDDSTRDVIERYRSISETLSETRQKAADVNSAISDYLSATVASQMAAEAHKSRSFDCKTAYHALDHANALKQDISQQRKELENKYKELREAYTSSQTKALGAKSSLMKQEMDWVGAKADYYSSRLQASTAADHLKTCRAAVTLADQRLKEAESESEKARARLGAMESRMDELLEKANHASHELESNHAGLMDILSQRHHREMTYLSAEQSASHAQQEVKRFTSEQGKIRKRLEAAKKIEEDMFKTVEDLRGELRELSGRSAEEFEEEQSVRRELREAEKEAYSASRERNEEYLNRALETNREKLGLRDQESATRTTRVLTVMVVLAIIAYTIVYVAQWQVVSVVFNVVVGLLGALFGSIATSMGISPRPWPRWFRRTGQLWKNLRSKLRSSRFGRGTPSK